MTERKRLTTEEAAIIVEAGRSYRKKSMVRMGLLTEPVVVGNRENEENKGEPGDYLVADGHGGYYVVSAEFHAENYERA